MRVVPSTINSLELHASEVGVVEHGMRLLRSLACHPDNRGALLVLVPLVLASLEVRPCASSVQYLWV
jgi:hypothetical protein